MDGQTSSNSLNSIRTVYNFWPHHGIQFLAEPWILPDTPGRSKILPTTFGNFWKSLMDGGTDAGKLLVYIRFC